MRLLVLTLVLAAAQAQVAEHANSGYKTKEGRSRVAQSLAASDRDGRQKPQELVDALQLAPGMTVADIGAGIGYMLPYFSKAVGPTGKVIAEDIFPDFLEQARETATKQGLSNVEFILGTEQDPKLAENSIDVAFTLDAYHHFNYPDKMLAAVARALKPGGRLVIVDFYKSGFRDPDHIRLDRDDVIREVERFGWRLLSKRDHLPGTQYIAIFEKR
ncbi:MAG: methyltransferase domain-containing protein [Bryobacteraceae bacterium]|nr:methyltransferase domain-containing protein [Bryobacteraceae bacterium]MDW8378523.1 methyltransferase domain-containing protein [Bryobacterales bacterium]